MSRRSKLTDEQRREHRLATHTKYNTSLKGKKRYARYEANNPDRAGNRWEPARNSMPKG